MLDKPIHREICITEKGLVIGYDAGSGIQMYMLNLASLNAISNVAEDGTITLGFKTSNIPITHDGDGDIKVTTEGLVLNNTDILSKNLKFIKTMDSSSITITDLADPENLTVLDLNILNNLTKKNLKYIKNKYSRFK